MFDLHLSLYNVVSTFFIIRETNTDSFYFLYYNLLHNIDSWYSSYYRSGCNCFRTLIIYYTQILPSRVHDISFCQFKYSPHIIRPAPLTPAQHPYLLLSLCKIKYNRSKHSPKFGLYVYSGPTSFANCNLVFAFFQERTGITRAAP